MKTSSRIYTIPLSALNIQDIPLVGVRAVAAKQVQDLGLVVPNGFVITTKVFDEVLNFYLKDNLTEIRTLDRHSNSQDIKRYCANFQKKIKKLDLEDNLKKLISNAYATFSGINDKFVAVRCSPTFYNSEVSIYYHTFLNVRGVEEVIDKIKECWISQFQPDVIASAFNKGFNLEEIKMAVLVQQMIQAEASGEIFSINPIDNDKEKLEVNAVLGLGEVLVSKEITPDNYILDKKKELIIEKHIATQDWMLVRKGRVKGKEDPNIKVKVSKLWGKSQKLSDENIIKLARIGKKLEDFYQSPQHVNWVYQGGKIWIIQANTLEHLKIGDLEGIDAPTAISLKNKLGEVGYIKKESQKENFEDGLKTENNLVGSQDVVSQSVSILNNKTSEIKTQLDDRIVEKADGEEKGIKMVNSRKPLPQPVLILKGKSVNSGVISGRVRIVRSRKDFKFVLADDILVVRRLSPNEMPSVIKVKAIITDDSEGEDNIVKELAQKMRIPCIASTQLATRILKDQEMITLDATRGEIFEGVNKIILKEENIKDVKETVKSNIGENKIISDEEKDSDLIRQQIKEESDKIVIIKKPHESAIKTGLSKTRKEVTGNHVSISQPLVITSVPPVSLSPSVARVGIESSKQTHTENEKTGEEEGSEGKKTGEKNIIDSSQKVDSETNDQMPINKKAVKEPPKISSGEAKTTNQIYKTATKVYANIFYPFKVEGIDIKNISGLILSKEIYDDENNKNSKKNENDLLSLIDIFKKVPAIPVWYKFAQDAFIGKPVKTEENKDTNTQSEITDIDIELENIKTIRNKNGYINLSLILPVVVNYEGLMNIKKILSSNGINRSSSLKFIQSIGTPANLYNLENLVKVGIDGFSLDYKMMMELMFGSSIVIGSKSRINKKMDASIEEVISKVGIFCTKNKIISNLFYEHENSINEELIEYAVKYGIGSIGVDPELIIETNKMISDKEHKLILKGI